MADKPRQGRKSGGKKTKPDVPTPPDDETKGGTEFTRIPEDIARMVKTIAQQRHRGWTTPAEVLNDPECPLKAWLVPIYNRVVADLAKHAARLTAEGQ